MQTALLSQTSKSTTTFTMRPPGSGPRPRRRRQHTGTLPDARGLRRQGARRVRAPLPALRVPYGWAVVVVVDTDVVEVVVVVDPDPPEGGDPGGTAGTVK